MGHGGIPLDTYFSTDNHISSKVGVFDMIKERRVKDFLDLCVRFRNTRVAAKLASYQLWACLDIDVIDAIRREAYGKS